MFKTIFCIFFALSLPLFFGACASVPEKLRTNKAETARLMRNIDGRKTASGSGSVTLKTPRRSITASGILVVDWPNGLRLEVQNPLGGTVAFVVIDQTDFWSYSEEEGIAWRGRVNAESSRRFLPIPLVPQDFFRALLARPDLEGVQPGKKEFSLDLSLKGKQQTMIWDPMNDQLTLWRIEAKGKEAYVEAEYSDYFLKSGQGFPRRVRLSYFQNGKENFRLVWQWHDLETYLPAISNPFSIPPAWAEGITTKEATDFGK